MGLTYGDLFTDLEIAITKQVISQFRATNSWLQEPGFEDLLQECLTHWFLQRSKFNPRRGTSVRAYMAKIVYIPFAGDTQGATG